MPKSISPFAPISRLVTYFRTRIILLFILLAAVSVATAALVSSRFFATAKNSSYNVVGAQAKSRARQPEIDFVHRGRLHPQLRAAADVLGDRLEKPGKERVLWIGTLSHVVNSETIISPVRILIEYPHHIRIEEQRGNQTDLIGFDGHSGWKHGGALSRHQEDLIESLVFDSVDHFFIGQGQGFGIRPLGTRFRDDDGSNQNYNGPFYDVYQFQDQIDIGANSRQQIKTYYFNSDTMLLERIRYDLSRDGISVPVEIQFSGWHQVNGQQMPSTITRLENGSPVIRLTINSVAIGAHQSDSSFDAVANQ